METMAGLPRSCQAFRGLCGEQRALGWSPVRLKSGRFCSSPNRDVPIVSRVLEVHNAPKSLFGIKNTRYLIRASAKLETAVDECVRKPLEELREGQLQVFHELPSGLELEVIEQKAEKGTKRRKSPLLFVHGSYHAAWCWAVRWMPFFAAQGFDCYAISLLGQGASDVPPQANVAGSLESHAADLAHFIRHKLSAPPVLVGHSFGGLIVQWYLGNTASTAGSEYPYPRPAGVVLACSIPPTGNGPMVMRFLKRDLLLSFKITLSLAGKLFGSSLSLCRESFFSPDLPEAELKRYQKLLNGSSRLPILDLRKVNDFLPVPRLQPGAPPVLVLGAKNDLIVDAEGIQETGEWYGTDPVVVNGIGHDIMLDTKWETATQSLLSWLESRAL